MQAATRPYVIAAAALAATSAVIAMPLISRPSPTPVRSIETRLVDASLLNVPINLFDDILSIPSNELDAIDQLAASLYFADNWFAVSPANLWGIDPGDPPKVEALVDMLFPFPALSGIDSGEVDWSAGLSQQVAGFAAAELPVNSGCAEGGCLPFVDGPYGMPQPYPGIDDTVPNIGNTNDAWILSTLEGHTPFPLIQDYFGVPLTGPDSLTSGYTFDSSYPGYYDAGSTVAYPSGYGFLGTETGPDGIFYTPNTGTVVDGVFQPPDPTTGTVETTNLVPWADTTYTLNLAQPFENFFDSLLQTPTGIAPLPTDDPFVELLGAAAVAFDPYAPGVVTPDGSGGVTELCSGACLTDPGSSEYFVSLLNQLFPNQPYIEEWLASDRGTEYPFNPLGVITPPDTASDAASGAASVDTSSGSADLSNLANLLDGQDASVATLSTDFNDLLASFDTGSFSTELTNLLAGSGFGDLSTDLSAMLAQFSATLTADLGANAATDALSLF